MRALINLIENQSKLPEYWYHGTESDRFEEFDGEFLNTRMGKHGVGFWFSANPDLSGFYGPNQVKVRLWINDPLIVTEENYEDQKKNGWGPQRWAVEALRNEHDAVILINIVDGDLPSTVCCVFDVENIEIVDFIVHDAE